MIWLTLWLYVWGVVITSFCIHLSGNDPKGFESGAISAFWPVAFPAVFVWAIIMGVRDRLKEG